VCTEPRGLATPLHLFLHSFPDRARLPRTSCVLGTLQTWRSKGQEIGRSKGQGTEGTRDSREQGTASTGLDGDWEDSWVLSWVLEGRCRFHSACALCTLAGQPSMPGGSQPPPPGPQPFILGWSLAPGGGSVVGGPDGCDCPSSNVGR
jgi:hypothetical protein